MKSSKSPRSSSFWTIFVFAAFSGLGAYLIVTGNPSERSTGWICALMFGAMALVMGVWEIGQHLQGEGVQWQEVHFGAQSRRVWLLQASRLEKVLLCAVFFIIALVGCAILITSPNVVYRLEMGISGGICAVCVLPFTLIRVRRAHGIALLAEGVLWLKDGTSLFIDWQAIEAVLPTRVAQDVGHGIQRHVPALGIRLCPDAVSGVMEVGKTSVPLKPKTRAVLAASRAQTGCDLNFLGESLIPTLAQSEHLLRFFLENPRSRSELRPDQTSLGFLESLLQDAAR